MAWAETSHSSINTAAAISNGISWDRAELASKKKREKGRKGDGEDTQLTWDKMSDK